MVALEFVKGFAELQNADANKAKLVLKFHIYMANSQAQRGESQIQQVMKTDHCNKPKYMKE